MCSEHTSNNIERVGFAPSLSISFFEFLSCSRYLYRFPTSHIQELIAGVYSSPPWNCGHTCATTEIYDTQIGGYLLINFLPQVDTIVSGNINNFCCNRCKGRTYPAVISEIVNSWIVPVRNWITSDALKLHKSATSGPRDFLGHRKEGFDSK